MYDFSDEQLERYSRHILLKDIGVEKQAKLLQSKVLIIGTGGLGSPISLYLTAAGVGEITLVDGDVVDLSNLQRQVVHFTSDLKVPKVKSAKEKLEKLNPDVKINTIHDIVHAGNALDIIKGYDFVIDGTDNFQAKFLINDACVLAKVPFSHGGVLQFAGQTMTIIPHETACYRCVFNAPPPPNAVPSCAQAGVLGAVAGMLGTIQATETLKFLTSTGITLTNQLLSFDALTMEFRKISVRKRANCPVCGDNVKNYVLKDEAPAVCKL